MWSVTLSVIFVLLFFSVVVCASYSPSGYIGCFKTKYKVFRGKSTNMTVDMCKRVCSAIGHRYTGTKSRNCFCFNRVPKACDMGPFSFEICGGNMCLPVYDTWQMTTTTKTNQTTSPIVQTTGTSSHHQGIEVAALKRRCDSTSPTIVAIVEAVMLLLVGSAIISWFIYRKYRGQQQERDPNNDEATANAHINNAYETLSVEALSSSSIYTHLQNRVSSEPMYSEPLM